MLIEGCHNDEQRIKLLEFFRFVETSGLAYERLVVPVSVLKIKPEAKEKIGLNSLEGMEVDFDICLPGRNMVFNLFCSGSEGVVSTKTEALARNAVERSLSRHYKKTGLQPSDNEDERIIVLSQAVRQHLIGLNLSFPQVLDTQMESPWIWGRHVEMWLLRGSNFDRLRSTLLAQKQ